MPYIEVKTNVQVQDHKQFIRELSSYAANVFNKPYVFTSIGIDAATKKKLSKELSEFLEKELKASSDRGYIFFYGPDGANVGWKGSVCG
ncbi:Tautomerase/MIF [Rhizophagus irregularis]|uniref:L-dopachrome isomerase n=1 Tax=Rhizophagus irregularis TaxID=588596 RepID=A0A2N1NC26_9GLOM|nr:Tautomerase/MIF [Rhizophagus irregularis]